MKTVTFMGLGYIGLPTALISTSSTYKVTGFDIDKNKVDELNSGKYLFFKDVSYAI